MTIGQQIKWDFKTNGDLEIKDKNGRTIYNEDSNGVWGKYELDSQGKVIYFEDSNGYWVKREWDSQGKVIYYENSKGDWVKREWDSQDKEIYYENSNGEIRDHRPKPCEGKEIVIDGEKYKLVKV
jgi:GTPase SAR1 family protein